MPLPWPKKATPAEAYSKIATVYDYLMRHVNYPRWFAYLDSFTNLLVTLKPTVLEAACGTGIMLAQFKAAGFRVLGFDRSRAMLHQARKRLGCTAEVALWVGDLRAPSVIAQADLGLCLYDSINYCLTEADLKEAFRNLYAAVKPDGLFIFDVVTRKNCRENFRNYYEHDTFEGCDFIRQSHYDATTDTQINEFHITMTGSGRGPTYYERHVQKIYELAYLRSILEQFPWELIGVYDNFSRRAATEKADRAHFVLRKS